MSKKIMMLALVVAGVAMYALPSLAAAADEPLHLNPTPIGARPITKVAGSVEPTLVAGSFTVRCGTFSGSASFEAGGTTGTINLKFGPTCTGPLGVHCQNAGGETGVINTLPLPFHLVTLPNSKPGVLITPNANGSFATFECGGIPTTVTGNGVIGTITEPTCGSTSTKTKIKFAAPGTPPVQEHTLVAGTSTVYRLMKGTENAAQTGEGEIDLGASTKLECT